MTAAVPGIAQLSLARPTTGRNEAVAFEALLAQASPWDRLVAGAAYPNPFHGRAVMAAHVAVGIGDTPRFCVVRRGADLVALLPLVPRRIGLWRKAAVGWATPFTTNGTPLVDASAMEPGIEGLLDALAAQSRLVMLRLVGLDHPVIAALREGLLRRGWPCCEIGCFDRPVLDRRDSFFAYEMQDLSGSRRKSLRRRRGRLADLGELTFATARAEPALAQAVDDFLALERAGWKGVRGTALASHGATADLARRLFAGGQGPVRARADMLCLDGRPIAMSLALVCGGTAHLLKTTFDESLRALAPGIVLEAEIVRAFHEEGFADRLDSASLPGGVLDDLYPDRERVGDLLFATNAEVSASALERIANAERHRRATMKRLKQVYSKLTGRR